MTAVFFVSLRDKVLFCHRGLREHGEERMKDRMNKMDRIKYWHVVNRTFGDHIDLSPPPFAGEVGRVRVREGALHCT